MSANLSKNTVAALAHAKQISFLPDVPCPSSVPQNLQSPALSTLRKKNTPSNRKNRDKTDEPIKTRAVTSVAPILLSDARIVKLAQLLPPSKTADHLALSLAMRLSEIGRRHGGDLGDLKPKQIAALLHWNDESLSAKDLLSALRTSELLGKDGVSTSSPSNPATVPPMFLAKHCAKREATQISPSAV